MENDLIKDFNDFLDERARKKTPNAPVAAKEATNAESNAFNAAMGLKFKCGLCEGNHRTATQGALNKISACGRKLKRLSESYIGGSSWSNDYRTIKLETVTSDHLDDMVPNNALFRATHPKLMKAVAKLSDRIQEQYVRTITTTVQVVEVLGAPRPVEYLKQRVAEHDKTYAEANMQLAEEQKAFAGPVYEQLKNYLTLKPEKVKIEKKYQETKFYREEDALAIDRVHFSGDYVGITQLADSFQTLDISRALFVSHPKHEIMNYVLDVDIWKDGYPAMIWTSRVLSGYNDRARGQHNKEKNAKVMFGVTLFSTWDRRVFILNQRHVARVEAVKEESLTEVVMPKDERDYRYGAYFRNS